jgi:hypothetical protein
MEFIRSNRPVLVRLASSISQNPFLAHAVVEIPASINFFLYSSSQLGLYSPQAQAVVKQYAVLLLSSVMIALSFAFRNNVDTLSGQVAGALALYHLAPMFRAIGKMNGGRLGWRPLFVLVAHAFCLARLSRCSWKFYRMRTLAAPC